MNITNLKNEVRAAFEEVDSKEYLQRQIERAKDRHAADFQDFVKQNPGSSFTEWKHRVEKSVNQHARESFMEIGVFLLALDELHDSVNS